MVRNQVRAYTDGSACVKGDKLGGFGVYIIDNDKEYFYRAGYKNTKTGRMELRAMITCLQQIEDKTSNVHIHSDSEYVVLCVSNRRLWMWQRKIWVGLKNVDLLKIYLEEYNKFVVPPKIFHVKGHTKKGDIHSLGNAIADALADYKSQKSFIMDLDY